MHRRPLLLTAALVSILAVTAPAVSADPLQIQSGFVFLDGAPARSFGLDFGFMGAGFAFLGEDTDTFDYFPQFSSSESPFRLRFSGVPDPATSSCPGCEYTGDFVFRFETLSGVGTSPFSMTGVLSGFAGGSTTPRIVAELTGSGTMHSNEESVLFAFEAEAAPPVPEPSTLLLIGSGAAILARRRNGQPKNG
jgi:hypothetical protein